MPTPGPPRHGGPLERVAGALACPVCGGGLRLAGRSLRCDRGHTFDLARQGYVNLVGAVAGSSASDGDTAEMVDARARFLAAGHYAPLAELLADLAARLAGRGGLVVDVGAGTGYHLAAVLDRLPGAVGLAVDLSRPALRRAARAHPRAAAVAWDVWRPLPLRTGSVSLLLDVFAPRNGAEFRRVLDPDGALLVVTPTPAHLAGLVERLGLLRVPATKQARLDAALSAGFRLVQRERRRIELELSPAEVELAVRMGPSAHHLDPTELRRRVEALGAPVPATAAFEVSAYLPDRPVSGPARSATVRG